MFVACSYVKRKFAYCTTTLVWWEPVNHSSSSEQGWLRCLCCQHPLHGCMGPRPASRWEHPAWTQSQRPFLLKLCQLGILWSSSHPLSKWIELGVSDLPFLSEITNKSQFHQHISLPMLFLEPEFAIAPPPMCVEVEEYQAVPHRPATYNYWHTTVPLHQSLPLQYLHLSLKFLLHTM